MTNALESIKQQLNNYWDSLDKRRRRYLLLMVGLIILAIVLVSVMLNRKEYVVLYSGLTEQEAAEVYTKLKEMNVQPKMEGRTTILVPKKDEAELRMQMTMEGYPKSGFNYDLYLESSSFGQTDDEMQKRWIIQLQERLGQSIRVLEGVEDAVVTIAMPRSDSFVLREKETPVSASVIVLPKKGYEITSEQAKSIEQLIATSVPGLKKENISIIDHKMNILNEEQVTESQLVSKQLQMKEQLEDRIKKEVKDLLEPVFGYGKVKTSVSVRLNFDKKVTESVTFEPVLDDSGIIVSQEILRERVNNITTGGVAGETDNTTQYPESLRDQDSSSQKDHRMINYEVNEIKEKIEEEQGSIEQLSIAVVIDNEELDQQTIEGVRELVATAMGTELDRVAVQSWAFNTDAQQDLIDAIEELRRERPRINTTALMIIIGGLVLVIVIIAYVNRRRQARLQEEAAIMAQSLLEEAQTPEEEIDLMDIEETEQDRMKRQLDEFANQHPEEIAQLLRNWLSED
ncbi:MAG: flagellar basal-body MS-ring/collar protein FliF [Caldicoprobacterales bacterium]|jgi:flagellar M-ring protein FliF|nr:flagellar M-ring protein FliF [Clostridiales bacterium]